MADRVFIKNTGDMKGEAWLEFWDTSQNEWEIGCRAKLMFMGKKCLVDTLDTPVKFRKRGYASQVIKELQSHFDEVEPIGVTDAAKGFWAKFGMKDGLGEE
jgi:hypothetical protein